MRIYFQLQTANDQGAFLSPPLVLGIELPWGCGIDSAKEEIEKAVQKTRDKALELYVAAMEGKPLEHE